MEIIVVILTIGVVLVVAAGYLWNFIRISKDTSFSGMTALRCIGIFAVPMGCVLGFIK